jgi:hypothetical protein
MDFKPKYIVKNNKNYHWIKSQKSLYEFIDDLPNNSHITKERIEHYKDEIKNYVKFVKNRFYVIYPNCDNLLFSDNKNYLINNNIRTKIKKQVGADFHINYTYLTNVISISYYKMLMIDWDEKEGYTLQKCKDLLNNLVREANKLLIPLTFGLVRTDRGFHAFLLSHQVKFNDIIIKLMCILESDVKYTAYVDSFGWAVRISQKNIAENDFVGKIGWDSNTQIIGDYHNINNQCWSWFIFHLYAIEYFKKYNSLEFYNFQLFEPENEKNKVEFINNIRNDLKQLWAFCSSDTPRFIQSIQLPRLQTEYDCKKGLNINPVILEGNHKIKRISIITEPSGLNIEKINNLDKFADYVYHNFSILNKNKITMRELGENVEYCNRRYYSEIKSHFIIYPNFDIYYRTKLNDLTNKQIIKHTQDFVIGVDGQRNIESRIFYILFRKILMFDWDFKDGYTEEDCIHIIQNIVYIAKSFDIHLCFKIIRTDRGVHAFELCNYWDYRDENTLKLMLGAYCDKWYVSNVNIKGWAIRINKKYNHDDDFIAKIGVLDNVYIGKNDKINNDIEKLIDFKIRVIDKFKDFNNKDIELILGEHQETIDNVRNILCRI